MAGAPARLLAAAALAATAATLAGCGSSQSPAGKLASAAAKSERAGGFHVAVAVTLGFPGGSQGQISGAGAFDGETGRLGLDLSNLLQNAALPLGSGRGVEARFLSEAGQPVLYLRMPYLDLQLPAGKRWFRLDLQRGGSAMGINFTQLLGQDGQSPAQMLDLLRASTHVTEIGPDIVGGAKVTQYHGVVDLHQAAKLGGATATGAQRALATGDPATIPVDVWIGDKDGLVHQIRSTSSTNIVGERVTTETLTTISRWGSHAAVTAPPKREVVDATGGAAAAPGSA
jgi:hypothetical protein